LENGRFGVVQYRVGFFFCLEGLLLDGVGLVDEAAQHRFFLDDARVVFDVRDARHAVHQLRQIGGAAGGFQVSLAVQLLGERHQVDGLLRFAKHDHLLEDAAVLVEEKVLGLELLDCRVEGVVIQQDGAQHAAFGIQVVGKRSLYSCLGGHRGPGFIFALFSPSGLADARTIFSGGLYGRPRNSAAPGG